MVLKTIFYSLLSILAFSSCNPANLRFVRNEQSKKQVVDTQFKEDYFNEITANDYTNEIIEDLVYTDIKPNNFQMNQEESNPVESQNLSNSQQSKHLFKNKSQKFKETNSIEENESEPSLREGRTLVTIGTIIYALGVISIILLISGASSLGGYVFLISISALLPLVGLCIFSAGFSRVNSLLRQHPKLAYTENRKEQSVGLILLSLSLSVFLATTFIILYGSILPWLAVLLYAIFIYTFIAALSFLTRKSRADYEEMQRLEGDMEQIQSEDKANENPRTLKQKKIKAGIAMSVILFGLLLLIILV